MYSEGDWVDNLGILCQVVHCDTSSLLVVLCDIDGCIHYQDKNSLQLITLPNHMQYDFEFISKMKNRCKIIKQNYFNHPKIKQRMRARKLIRKELRRISKTYTDIISEINDMLRKESENTGRSIIYDCVEICTAQDILFYYSNHGFTAKIFGDIPDHAAAIQISWDIKK